jgi:hypothetical protein
MSRTALVTFVLAAALSLIAAPASATTWNVKSDGTGDVPTIQAAVDAAGTGDEILVHPGAYTWANQGTGTDFALITFLRDVGGFTMRSVGGAESTILNAQGQGRVIYLQAYNEVTIEGFTIKNGNAPLFGDFDGGGVIAHLCPTVFRDCVITGNTARHGGGVWCGGVSSMSFIDCEISNNTAEEGGGILFINSTTATCYLSGCIIKENTSLYRGGGVLLYRNFLAMDNTIIARNNAGTFGGALYTYEVPPSTITNCTMAGNGALDAGGGIYVMATSDVTLSNSIIAFSQDGGAIFLDPTSALAVGCNDIYGNGGGDAIPAGALDLGGNFSADPEFCGPVNTYDLTLEGDSPCAPGNDPGGGACGLIGALPVGCGDVPVENSSWGRIKALYLD